MIGLRYWNNSINIDSSEVTLSNNPVSVGALVL